VRQKRDECVILDAQAGMRGKGEDLIGCEQVQRESWST